MSLMSGNDTESFLAGFYIDTIVFYVCFFSLSKTNHPHHIFYLLVNYYNTVTVMKNMELF